MTSKVVSQRTQDKIKKDLGDVLSGFEAEDAVYGFDILKDRNIIAQQYDDNGQVVAEYEIITVVIPKQAAHNTEVRHG